LATIIGALTPITIAVIVFGFRISNDLAVLKSKDSDQIKTIDEMKEFNEKCKAGKVHDRPFGYCFEIFELKHKERKHEFSACER
jgi:hypothetical protein